jgi:hypothetical protein
MSVELEKLMRGGSMYYGLLNEDCVRAVIKRWYKNTVGSELEGSMLEAYVTEFYKTCSEQDFRTITAEDEELMTRDAVIQCMVAAFQCEEKDIMAKFICDIKIETYSSSPEVKALHNVEVLGLTVPDVKVSLDRTFIVRWDKGFTIVEGE